MKKKNVVTIGGGTGSFTLLSGLKNYPINISAIVSMADDGGSTGILRDELGVLPPGDVRQCLVALSNSSENLRELMNYRFEEGGLKGHSFGNLFLSALEKIEKSFSAGVEEATKILNVSGEVIPVVDKEIDLFVLLNNGRILRGENEINHNTEIEKVGIKKIYLEPQAQANKKAIQRILEADVIVIGPGNHYCSIVPNFLVKGISEAIRKSKAKVIYNCNLVNKNGHTEKFSLDDYVASINKCLGKERIDFVTFNSRKPSKQLIARYEKIKDILVGFDKQAVRKRSYRVIQANVLSGKQPRLSQADSLSEQRAFIRHDSNKLAKLIMMILELGDYESIIKEII
jgi:uncharacterized cofD-like protein